MIPLPPKVHSLSSTLHPAFAMRGLQQYIPGIITVMARARRWSNAFQGPTRPQNIICEPTPEEVLAHIRKARAGGGIIAVDIETPRNAPYQITMVGISGVRDVAVCMPWCEPYISILKEMLEDETLTKVGHNFSYDENAFYRNGIRPKGVIYDTIHAGALLWPPIQKKKKKGLRKVRSMKWLDLASCVLRVCDGVAYWKEPENEATKSILSASYPHVPAWLQTRLYCSLDAIYTYNLWQVQRELLRREGMWELYSRIVAPAAQTLVRLEVRGIRVDEAKRERLREIVSANIERLKGEIANEVAAFHALRRQRVVDALAGVEGRLVARLERGCGTRCEEHPEYAGLIKRTKCTGCAGVFEKAYGLRADVNDLKARVKKGKAVLERIGETFNYTDDAWRSLLFSPKPLGLGLTPIEFTAKTHEGKVSNKVMEALFEQHPDLPILRMRIALQSDERRLSVGLAAPLDENGRAHFAFSMNRSALGRLTSGEDDTDSDKVRYSSGGNGQNLRPEDRMIYCASPGHVIVHADWSQIEARNVAWHAKETSLLDAWLEGRDTHSENAAMMYGIPVAEARTHMVMFKGQRVPARKGGKHIVHAMNYGLQVPEAARQVGCSIAEAQRMFDAYYKLRPMLPKYHADTLASVSANNGVLVNSFGRKWKFHYTYRKQDGTMVFEDRNVILAAVGQSETSDQCKAVLPEVEACAEKHGGALLLTTHDSFDADIPAPNAPAYIADLTTILTREWPQLGKLEKYGYFRCPIDVEVGSNLGEHHVCTPKCPDPCVLENPDGLRPWSADAHI